MLIQGLIAGIVVLLVLVVYMHMTKPDVEKAKQEAVAEALSSFTTQAAAEALAKKFVSVDSGTFKYYPGWTTSGTIGPMSLDRMAELQGVEKPRTLEAKQAVCDANPNCKGFTTSGWGFGGDVQMDKSQWKCFYEGCDCEDRTRLRRGVYISKSVA